MPFAGKTNWKMGDIVKPDDMNRIEQGISTLDVNKQNLLSTISGAATVKEYDKIVVLDSGDGDAPKGMVYSTLKQILASYLRGTFVAKDALVHTLTSTDNNAALSAPMGKKLNDEKANKSTVTTSTLNASSWSGEVAPYTYTLTVSGVTATSVQELLPSVDITTEQLEALQAANIVDGGQSALTIYLKAFGDKPTIDIPVRVIRRGDV